MSFFNKLKQRIQAERSDAGDTSILRELLRPSRLTHVVDVGANPIDGDPPYKAMLQRGLCRVTGFEPQEEALAALESAKGPNEKYLPYAVGDGGSHTLRICRAPGMTSLFAPDRKTLGLFPVLDALGEVQREIPVQTKRLDDISEIDALDFLKIDVQGAELSVFLGGKQKLANAVAVQTEVSFLTIYENQPALGDVDLELRRQGFIPHCFAAIKLWPIAPYVHDENPRQPVRQLLEADLVYVRDFSRHESMGDEQLKHLALVAEQCYGSVDLVLRCLMLLEQRRAIADGSQARYVEWMRTEGHRARSA